MAKRAKRWWLRIAIALVILFLALPLLTVLVIRWRTTVAWEKFRTHWEAQGEKFELEDHLPAPVPDDQNLALHPLFVDLHLDDTTPPPWTAKVDLFKVLGYRETSGKTRKDLCESADFTNWQSIPPGATPEERLAEIRKRLEPLNEPLDQLAAAIAERPFCRYELNWNDTFTMSTPHMFVFMKANQAYARRASLRLASGDASGTARDLDSMHRLAGMLGDDTHLLALLIEISGHLGAVQVLWDGLNQRAFSEADLQQLDRALAEIEPLPERLLSSLRMERAFILRFLDQLEADPEGLRESLGRRDVDGVKGFGIRMWISASRLGASEDLQEAVLSRGGTPVTRAEWKAFDEWERRITKRWSGPRKFVETLAALATPALSSAAQRAFLVEAEIANARLAIALERHRLARGSYPAALADLVPDYLPAVPEDRINGRPIEYRLKPDGTPLVYQWGFDGDDDGGIPRKHNGFGDITWQYTLPRGFTEAEWQQWN